MIKVTRPEQVAMEGSSLHEALSNIDPFPQMLIMSEEELKRIVEDAYAGGEANIVSQADYWKMLQDEQMK